MSSATYTYPRTGVFRVTAQIGDTDGDSVSVSTSNVVTEAAITATGVTIHPAQTPASLSNVVVATFNDADHFLKAADFSATDQLGRRPDLGREDRGRQAIGGFEVWRSHRYRTTGTFSVNTTIRQGHAAISTLLRDVQPDLGWGRGRRSR